MKSNCPRMTLSWAKPRKHHRLDGPATIYEDGDREYWVDGKLHREDGPAVDYPSEGTEEYYLNGQRHRTDGPAVELINGYKEYWVNGIALTEQQFLEEQRKTQ